MNRITGAIVWFFALWIGLLMLGGLYVSISAPDPGTSLSNSFQIGKQTSSVFYHRFGPLLGLGSFVVATVGAFLRLLPGVRKAAGQ